MSFLFRQSARQATRPPAHTLRLPARPQWRAARGLSADLAKPPVWKHVVFCLGVSGGVMLYGAYKTEGETQHYLDKLGRTGLTFPARDLRNARRVEHLEAVDKKLRARSPGVREDELPLLEKLIRATVLVPWHNATDTDRLKWFTVAGCAAVFIAWQAPLAPLRNFMRAFWSHHPLSGRKITHLTATFSHQDIYHLGFNMVAFVSFVPAVVATLDRDDVAQHRKPGGELSRIQVTPVWELAAFVVAGGLVSSLASHLWSVRVLLPRAVRAVKAQAPVLRSAAAVQSTVEAHSIGSSLGLSGAVYAMLVYVAANNPDLSVGILFLPFISIPIGPAVGVLATFDLLALLRGWKIFDHAAHLGGALFGGLWYYYGAPTWATMRDWFRRYNYVHRVDFPINPYGR